VAGATGYELMVAVDSMLGLEVNVGTQTSYEIKDALNYDTTYYWQVRIVMGEQKGQSIYSSFTTEKVPSQ